MNGFDGITTEDRDVPEIADLAPAVCGAGRLRTVLDHRQTSGLRDFQDRVEVPADKAVQMMKQDGPRAGGDRLPQLFFVEPIGIELDVREHGFQTGVSQRVRDHDAAVSRHHDFVAGAQVQGGERCAQRDPATGERGSGSIAVPGGELLLERFDRSLRIPVAAIGQQARRKIRSSASSVIAVVEV